MSTESIVSFGDGERNPSWPEDTVPFPGRGESSLKFVEGKSAQILHVGPYAAERTTIEKLHKFVEEQGYALRGKHHEIYMGDPRRSAPEKLRTIIRHPVK